MYKKIVLLFTMFCSHIAVFACSVCEKQQPKMLQGITHGTGPQSDWDYAAVWAIIVVVVATLYFSLKWMIWPGEKSPTHIKRMILKNE